MPKPLSPTSLSVAWQRSVCGERAQRPVVVALTGHDDPATLERCAHAGCRTVLVKPIRPLELKSQIAAWLDERAVA